MSFFELLRRSSWIGLLPWQFLLLVVLLTANWPSPALVPMFTWEPGLGRHFGAALGGMIWFILLPLIRQRFHETKLGPYPGEFELSLPMDRRRLLLAHFLALDLDFLCAPILYVVVLLLAFSALPGWTSADGMESMGLAALTLSWMILLPVWIQHASMHRRSGSSAAQLLGIFLAYLLVGILYLVIPAQRPDAPVHWLGFLSLAFSLGLQVAMFRRCLEPVEFAGMGSEPGKRTRITGRSWPTRRSGSKAIRYFVHMEIWQTLPFQLVIFFGLMFFAALLHGGVLSTLLLILFLIHRGNLIVIYRVGRVGSLPLPSLRSGREILLYPFFVMMAFCWFLFPLGLDDFGSHSPESRHDLTVSTTRADDVDGPPRRTGYRITGLLGWPAVGWSGSTWFSGGKPSVSPFERVQILGPWVPFWIQGNARVPASVSPETIQEMLQMRMGASIGGEIPVSVLREVLDEDGPGRVGTAKGVRWESGLGRLYVDAAKSGRGWQEFFLIATLLLLAYGFLVTRDLPVRRYPQSSPSAPRAAVQVLSLIGLLWLLMRFESQAPESLASLFHMLVASMPPLYLSWALPLLTAVLVWVVVRRRLRGYEVPASAPPGLTERWLGPRGEWRPILLGSPQCSEQVKQ